MSRSNPSWISCSPPQEAYPRVGPTRDADFPDWSEVHAALARDVAEIGETELRLTGRRLVRSQLASRPSYELNSGALVAIRNSSALFEGRIKAVVDFACSMAEPIVDGDVVMFELHLDDESRSILLAVAEYLNDEIDGLDEDEMDSAMQGAQLSLMDAIFKLDRPGHA